ncbi:MAG: DUF72 domain-containing protein [Thermoplasmata archaeon]
MEIRTGCSGWSYSQWVGTFYPMGTKTSDYLKIYSRIFDIVEIDSSFYRIPDPRTVENWFDAVPENFSFTAKMPQTVTHDLRLKNASDEARKFIDVIAKLGDKLRAILIQLPPSLTFEEGYKNLKNLIDNLPSGPSYSVEMRHDSWFVDDTFSMLRERRVGVAWSEIPYAHVPAVVTSDTVYLRFVGDRSIRENEFGKVLKDRSVEIGSWARELKKKEDMVKHAFILSNNHFQGFGPATVNLFRKMSGLNTIDWTTRTGQTTLL